MRALALAFAVALVATATPGLTQSIQKGAADTEEQPPPGVFGPFDRLRQRAADAGVTLSARYTSEFGYNASGGDSHRATETGQADIGAKIDLEKLAGIKGGTFDGVVTWRRGKLLDDVAGIDALQQTQEVYGRGQTWRLTRLWYEQLLGRASLKIGRSNVGEDFAAFSCDFMNLTFCGAQPGNIVGNYWFNWPVSQWMGRAKMALGDGYIQLGAYEVNPLNLSKAFTIGHFHGATGVLIPFEGVWRPTLNGRPGTYRVGAWYDTSSADDAVLDQKGDIAMLSDLDPLQRQGRWGAWAILRQQITGSADAHGTVRGLSLFARATRADRRTSRLDSQVSVGMFYEGLQIVAPDDVLGIAVGRTHVNSRVGHAERIAGEPKQGSEYVGEIFYSLHPVPGLVIRPNVQFVANPGGRDAPGDVVVREDCDHAVNAVKS